MERERAIEARFFLQQAKLQAILESYRRYIYGENFLVTELADRVPG